MQDFPDSNPFFGGKRAGRGFERALGPAHAETA